MDAETFEKLVSRFGPDIAELARAARRLVVEFMPGVYEIVWPGMQTVGYGTGPKKMTEHFAWLSPYGGHVVLGFYYGAELPDPEGLLEGTGKRMRHLKLRSADDLRRPGVSALLEHASRHRVPPLRDDPRAAADLEKARKSALSGA
ncbi:MAG TPA: DUF1801 domain-containing protein [Candidatus Limnocylindria bacterium]|nr:DUF1801 domain-containing protein [Candidatus Limnocylindria bacterium]